MNKEMFNKIVEVLTTVPMDNWTVGRTQNRQYRFIESGSIKLFDDGDLRINDVAQYVGFFQKVKIAKLAERIITEVSVRTAQREFGVA